MSTPLTGTNLDFSDNDGNVSDNTDNDRDVTGWTHTSVNNNGASVSVNSGNFGIYDADSAAGSTNAAAFLSQIKAGVNRYTHQELNETIQSDWTEIDFSFDAANLRDVDMDGKSEFSIYIDMDGDGLPTGDNDIVLSITNIGAALNGQPTGAFYNINGTIDLTALSPEVRDAINGQQIHIAFRARQTDTKLTFAFDNVQLNYTQTPPCFTKGTFIKVPKGGEVLIESLCVGDLIWTKDNGYQAIRWIGERTLHARDKLRPIIFRKGAIGNKRAFRLSPQHRVLVDHWKMRLLFDFKEALVPAHKLVNDHNILWDEEGEVTYYHLLLDNHEIIYADGALVETLLPSFRALQTIDSAATREILEIFPELETFGDVPPARPIIGGSEAQILNIIVAP